MNLLNEPWIKISRQSGAIEYIAPYQITSHYDSDPIIALIAPRADFKGALMQFLVGLLQTAFSDIKAYKWRELYKNPPRPENLRDKLLVFAKAFEVNKDGPSFMQDLELANAEIKPLSSLLLEQPGENTLEKNLDHFVKRDQINGLCPICAVTALFTLQLNAPSGGAGHRTSIRGGGPLTTLILKKNIDGSASTLWENLWLNIRADKSEYKIIEDTRFQDIFPWFAPTRTSEKKTGVDTTIKDVHPLQMFWAMPRRIRLDFETFIKGTCDICGAQSEKLLIQYQTKNYGINYTGTWDHPLSPYSQKTSGELLPIHPQPGGIGYKHWLSLVLGMNSKSKPAAVISDYLHKKEKGKDLIDKQCQIWAFGYDMDNMKARCWYESQLPYIHGPEDSITEFQEAVYTLLEAAGLVLSYSRSVVKKANGDTVRLEMRFWHETEADFYNFLEEIKRAVEAGQRLLEINERWYSILTHKALDLYNHIVMADLSKKAKYFNELKKYLQGKKLRSLLSLSVTRKEGGKRANKR